MFTADATLVFPETLPKGGTYNSPWEALEYFNNVGELFEDPHAEPGEFIRDGDRLVVLGHFHGRSRSTGEQVAIRFLHVFRLTGVEGPLSQQRNAAFELFIDTAAVVAATTRGMNSANVGTGGRAAATPAIRSAGLTPSFANSTSAASTSGRPLVMFCVVMRHHRRGPRRTRG